MLVLGWDTFFAAILAFFRVCVMSGGLKLLLGLFSVDAECGVSSDLFLMKDVRIVCFSLALALLLLDMVSIS